MKLKNKKKNIEIEKLEFEVTLRNLVFTKMLENNELTKERLVELINEVTDNLKGGVDK